jgi:PAS domain-containing protein
MLIPSNPLALVYRIDDQGRISYVNPAWSDFARANQGEAVMPEQVMGSTLMESVEDPTVQQLYSEMIKRARAGKPVRFKYRCDAPDRRRTFEMDIRQLDNGEVEFISALRHEEMRPAVAMLQAGAPRDQRLLRVCSWCQRVALPDHTWVPVEVAVQNTRAAGGRDVPGADPRHL